MTTTRPMFETAKVHEVQPQLMIDPELERAVIRAYSTYHKGLPSETGQGLRASLRNMQNSIDYFISRGFPENHPYIQSLKNLLEKNKERTQ